MTRMEPKSFKYEGNDDMIDFEKDEIPPVNPDFKAILVYDDGAERPADQQMRKKIWEWWYENRKIEILEIQNAVITSIAKQLIR